MDGPRPVVLGGREVAGVDGDGVVLRLEVAPEVDDPSRAVAPEKSGVVDPLHAPTPTRRITPTPARVLARRPEAVRRREAGRPQAGRVPVMVLDATGPVGPAPTAVAIVDAMDAGQAHHNVLVRTDRGEFSAGSETEFGGAARRSRCRRMASPASSATSCRRPPVNTPSSCVRQDWPWLPPCRTQEF